MELEQIQTLIPILKANGVSQFKSGDTEILFFAPIATESPTQTMDALQGLKQQEESLPPDLRTDSIHDFNKMLNWSAPAGHDDTLPLTGEDAPLGV